MLGPWHPQVGVQARVLGLTGPAVADIWRVFFVFIFLFLSLSASPHLKNKKLFVYLFESYEEGRRNEDTFYPLIHSPSGCNSFSGAPVQVQGPKHAAILHCFPKGLSREQVGPACVGGWELAAPASRGQMATPGHSQRSSSSSAKVKSENTRQGILTQQSPQLALKKLLEETRETDPFPALSTVLTARPGTHPAA